MAEKEGAQVDTLPSQMYGWDGAPVRVGADGDAIKVSDESISLLRRIVKLLESNATVDIANRQKVTLDASSTGIFSYPGIGGSNIGSTPTASAPNAPQLAYPITIWEMPVDQRWRVMEESRVSYQTGVRSHLAFS